MSHYEADNDHLLDDAIEALRAIEEAMQANDPYNNPDYSPEYRTTLEDCVFPYHIADDPLRLLRVDLGEQHTRMLEYIGDLEFIAEELSACIRARGGAA